MVVEVKIVLQEPCFCCVIRYRESNHDVTNVSCITACVGMLLEFIEQKQSNLLASRTTLIVILLYLSNVTTAVMYVGHG